jgi:hypothetical protein
MSFEQFCQRCGKTLPGPASTRSDKRFCSASCRSAAWRNHRSGQADELLRILSGQEPPVRWHERSVVDRPTRAMRDAEAQYAAAFAEELTLSLQPGYWATRLSQVLKHRQDLVDSFGTSVITAAAKPESAGVCRVCMAVTYAKVHNLAPPRLDGAAVRLLGGKLCPKCAPAARGAATATLERRAAPAAATLAPRPRPRPQRPLPSL